MLPFFYTKESLENIPCRNRTLRGKLLNYKPILPPIDEQDPSRKGQIIYQLDFREVTKWYKVLGIQKYVSF